MTKINHEEYEILKGLEDIWKWIARDNKGFNTKLKVHTSRPGKMIDSRWSSGDIMLQLSEREGLFQFVQWEDEEPYNIAELIEEYEKESEETEVKNLKEIRSEFENKLIQITKGRHPMLKIAVLNAVSDLFNQLDEPDKRVQLEIAYKDILSRREFLFGDKKYVVVEKSTAEEEQVMEWLDNNDFYDHRTAETVLANAVDKGELGYYGTKYSVVKKEPETVADVVTTFWKSYERLKEVMSMEVEELEE